MKQKRSYKKPSFYVISSAMDGDKISIDKILDFYDPYISKSCIRPLYDEYGNVYFTYELNSNGTALFYYVTVKRGASSYWTCNFVCPQAQKQENLERFGLWASKIEVE